MGYAHTAGAPNTRFVKVGSDVFAVYGDDKGGWSVDPRDLSALMPKEFRYGTLDELFFALVNMNLNCEGRS